MRIAVTVVTVGLMANAVGQTSSFMGKDGIKLGAPPVTEKHPVTDTYKVAGGPDATVMDDYRWLEDAKSPATRAYIAAQNAYTQTYLDQVKMLPSVRTEMAALLKVDSISTPTERGGRFFYTKRLAEENQGSIYMREGLRGAEVKLSMGRGGVRMGILQSTFRA